MFRFDTCANSVDQGFNSYRGTFLLLLTFYRSPTPQPGRTRPTRGEGTATVLCAETKDVVSQFREESEPRTGALALVRRRCANESRAHNKKLTSFSCVGEQETRGDGAGAIFRTTDCAASQTFPRKRAEGLRLRGNENNRARIAFPRRPGNVIAPGRDVSGARERLFVLRARLS